MGGRMGLLPSTASTSPHPWPTEADQVAKLDALAKPHPHLSITEEQYVSEGATQEELPDNVTYRDAGTITDVCNSTELPEVEIISLLEEQLPLYHLRADTIYGYEHDDWIHTPLVPVEANIDLTTEQIEETLSYFLLCGERVGQMTRTYSDIDAVTRLLEEKERDLELAARIGQSLLKKNRGLTEQNRYLEEQVGRIQDEVAQLHHELTMKEELLRFYTSVADESEGDFSSSTPLRRNKSTSSMPSCFPVDSLQKKLQDLEIENVQLRSEASHLKTETVSYEEKEHQLVNDCVRELRESNLQITSIAEELARKTEDASRQQEEITHLLSQIVDLQKKTKSYAVENEELTQHLAAAKDAQLQLTSELLELENKYSECMEMLHEAHQELKNLRNRSLPGSTSRRFHPLGLFPMDSLAAEIEGTMRKELQTHTSEPEEQKVDPKRTFEAVKNINQTPKPRPLPSNIPGSNQQSSPLKSPLPCGLSNLCNNNVTLLSPEPSLDDSNKCLEAALRRLAMRRENYLSERRFSREERERKLCGRSIGLTHSDSIMSLAVSGCTFSSRSYLPDKLQIVKPLEGSATLHHWQQLAQPNLGGILDQRPGVLPKGFRPLELENIYQLDELEEDEPEDLYFQSFPISTPSAASDGSYASTPISICGHNVYNPGKCLSHTNSTYTFTTCRILHPTDELTQVTPRQAVDLLPPPTPSSYSLMPGSLASCLLPNSRMSTPAATPCTPRRLSLAESFTNLRDSTKTTSTSLGLVRMLQERGISAAVYAPPAGWSGTRTGIMAPLSTPPNSPSSAHAPPISPDGFQVPSSPPYDKFLASRPARFILREVVGEESRSQAEQGSQTDVSIYNLNLVDKLRRFGVAPVAPRPPFALNSDLRRNRSYPAMVGASMAMKGPGPQTSEMLLASKLPRQTSH